jgi:hypothetical protein
MLRRLRERRQLVAPERDKDTTRRGAEGMHCVAEIFRFDPVVIGARNPWRTAQGDKAHAADLRGSGRIGRDASGIRMGGGDQNIDALTPEIIRKTGGTAETATAHRNGLARRRRRPPGERQRHLERGAGGEPRCQQSRFGRAAENKDARHAAS